MSDATRPAGPGYPGYGAPIEQPDAVSFGYYLRTLYRRRWLALTVCVLVGTTGIMRTFTLIPSYEARVRLLLDAERLNLVEQFQEVVEPDDASATYFQTQLMILQSRSLARRTLVATGVLDTDRHPAVPRETNGHEPTPDVSQPASGLVASILAGVGPVWQMVSGAPAHRTPPTSRAPSESDAEARQIDAFLSGLVVTPIPNSRLIDLKYRSSDPQIAADYANAIARQYIDQNLEFKFLATKEATDWLAARLAEQREAVEQSEQALLAFRQQTGVVTTGPSDTVALQKLSDVTRALTEARAARIEKEALYNQALALQHERASLDAFPAVLQNSYIQQLKIELANAQRQYARLSQDFGERHPDMINARATIQTSQARLDTEIAKVIQSVRADYVATRATEASLVQAFENQKREALAQDQRAVSLAALQREAESNKQIYEILMQRSKETGITGELRRNNIRVLDAAEVPRAPIWPNRSEEIRNAIILAFAAAFGMVILVHILDNRIKLPEEIKAQLGLPLLGSVPRIKLGSKPKTRPLINNGVPGEFSEALRLVRTNVLFSEVGEGRRSLLVTSPGIGEGKTSVACNLAIAIAQAGQRVLLIDGDLRRPRVHELFSRRLEPGLTNLLLGTAKANDVIQPSGVSGLQVMPAGSIPPNPAEILASSRFKNLIGQLEGHLDWIIVDSPPVMAVADASEIAHAVGRVVFVIRAEKTSRGEARAAVERLLGVGARFAGAVLNNLDTNRHRYYYAQYHRRNYAAYYTQPAANK